MTFAEALADLKARRDAVPEVVELSLHDVGELAVGQVQAQWPVDSGESHDAWQWDRSQVALTNDAPHTPYVHDGLADTLIPEVLRGLEPTFEQIVTRRLDAAGRP